MKVRSKPKQSDPIRWIIGGFGILFILISLYILFSDLSIYRQANRVYPAGVSIASIPVGGLTRAEAETRLEQVFSIPIELRYGEARMQFTPDELGWRLDTAATLDSLEAALPNTGWWQHLWGQSMTAVNTDFPMQVSFNTEACRAFLAENIIPRYDKPATAALPILYTTNYTPGQKGLELNMGAALPAIQDALRSPSARIVNLPVNETPALPLDPANLEVFLKQTILLSGFNGLVELYTQLLPQGDALHFAVRANEPVTPDVAYSAASTIKIPIMVSVFNHLGEPTPDLALGWMRAMITQSDNPPADALMRTYLDENLGPLIVTEDMRALGYQNTFLAGYFYAGAPLLQRIQTPANSRTDVYLDPDFYNQTVPSEIGDLLARIYRCAAASDAQQNDLFPGSVTPSECQMMLDLLAENKIGALIEAGLPPEGDAAHKHGWTSDLDGLLHTMSDAGIVATPGGDYILIIFINSPQQLFFDEGNWLFARLSQVIYNAFNLENQAAWLGS
ncbi:MAG TPA: hypothetical protein DCG78_03240 [Anaerolineaceae bacterium]|nr:MAG: hypothetical protein XD89_0435 [Anaerolineae bacterium 49_20]HAE85509.1 hypothetical protein [Anaerolineaceae bacterium]